MRFRLRKPVPYKVLALTEKYQKRFPGTWNNKPAPGRIALEKRPEYNKKVAKLLVRDKTLRKHLLTTGISRDEQRRRIIEYALKKTKGDKQQARRFLDETVKQIKEGVKVNRALLKEKAKKQGKNKQEIIDFAKHINHMYTSAAQSHTTFLVSCSYKIG